MRITEEALEIAALSREIDRLDAHTDNPSDTVYLQERLRKKVCDAIWGGMDELEAAFLSGISLNRIREWTSEW